MRLIAFCSGVLQGYVVLMRKMITKGVLRDGNEMKTNKTMIAPERYIDESPYYGILAH